LQGSGRDENLIYANGQFFDISSFTKDEDSSNQLIKILKITLFSESIIQLRYCWVTPHHIQPFVGKSAITVAHPLTMVLPKMDTGLDRTTISHFSQSDGLARLLRLCGGNARASVHLHPCAPAPKIHLAE
jgi:hypothetical protein